MAQSNPQILQDDQVIWTISFIVRINEWVAFSVENGFYLYLATIFNELLEVYQIYSQNISYIYAQKQENHN